jgi:hypothetical protein
MIVSVVPVGPRRKTLAEQYFALHVTTALDAMGTGPLPSLTKAELQDLLLPWQGKKWQAELVVRARAKTGPRTFQHATFRGVIDSSHQTPKLAGEPARNEIKGWVDVTKYNVRWSADPVSPAGPRPLREALAYLATMPGEIPQELGLVHYFRIVAPATPGPFGVEDIESFIVAPAFKEPDQAPQDKYDFDPELVSPEIADHVAARWDYDPVVGAPERVVHVQAVKVAYPVAAGAGPQLVRFDDEPSSTTAPGLHLGDYWLRSQDADGAWSDDLVERFASALDLPARLVGLRRFVRDWRTTDTTTDSVHTAKMLEDTRLQAGDHLDRIEDRLLRQALGYHATWTDAEATSVLNALSDPQELESSSLPGLARAVFQTRLGAFVAAMTNPGDAAKSAVWRNAILQLALGEVPDGITLETMVTDQPDLTDRMLYLVWRAIALQPAPGRPQSPDEKALIKWWSDVESNPKAKARVERLLGLGAGSAQALPAGRRRALAVAAVAAITGALSSANPREPAENELLARLGPLAQAPFADSWPRLVDAVDFPKLLWGDYSVGYSKRLFEHLPHPTTPVGRAEVKPSGLTIQVDHTTQDPTVAGGPGARDPWQNIAGVGVVVRDTTADVTGARWRFVSTAMLSSRSGLTLFEREPALVPVRIPYREGLRFPFITYDHRSLVAESPLSPAVSGSFDVKGRMDSVLGRDDQKALYRYDPVLAGTPEEKARLDGSLLTRLVFGHTYEMAAFVIDAAGGLPDTLTARASGDPAHVPWILATDWDVPRDLGKVIVPFTYRRRVGVGHPRVAALSEKKEGWISVDWPAIPADVHPLASELVPDQPARVGPSDPGRHGRPPLLLHPEQRDLTIGVKPPTVDIEVLDRWLDSANEVRARRGEHLARIQKRQPGSEALRDTDLAFDDPAVTHLAIKIEWWDFSQPTKGGWTSNGDAAWGVVKLADRAKGADGWINLVVAMQPDAAAGPSDWKAAWTIGVNGASVAITAPANAEGALIGRVSVHALVPLLSAARFDSLAFPEPKTPDPAAPDATAPDAKAPDFDLLDTEAEGTCPAQIKRDFRILKPQQFHVEVASAAFPTEVELLAAFSVESNPLARRVEARLAYPAGGKAGGFRNITRCEILKQPWRWQGRPLPQWPGIASASGAQGATAREIEDWELAAFAGLDDLFDTEPVNIGYVPLQSVNAPRSEGIYTDDWSHKPPISRYVRYALRAHSRYAGLFPQRRQPTTTRTNESRSISWQSAFLRYAGPTPSLPVIRAIVPLTEPADSARGLDVVAPLLVVLDEQAFDRCGVTEALECQIMAEETSVYVKPPPDPEIDQKTHLQYGHDPIIDTAVDPRIFDRSAPVSMPVDGPFGYTFDTDARQPRFVASSYLIRPPEINGVRAWDFAKVRFRRLAEGPTRGAAPDASPRPADADAKLWTRPLWIQLPPSRRFNLAWKEVAVRQVSDRIEIATPSGERGDLSDHTARFAHYVLVTAAVRDFRGSAGHERYIEIALARVGGQDSSVLLTSEPLANPGSGEQRWIRIVEVQIGHNVVPPSVSDEFWRQLLDAESGEDAKYRITRVSPRLELRAR